MHYDDIRCGLLIDVDVWYRDKTALSITDHSPGGSSP